VEDLYIPDNYTKVPNEILEALARINLSSYEVRILLFIIRKTNGWQKKTDWISLSQLSQGTGIHKSHVCRTIKSLVTRNIIVKGRDKRVGLQTNYAKWVQKSRKSQGRTPSLV